MDYLRLLVLYLLDTGLGANAEFAAERLVAAGRTPENLHLYALVLQRMGRTKAAFNTTAGVAHVGCAYVRAQCALALGCHQEGIAALRECQSTWDSPDRFRAGDNVCGGYEQTRRLIPDAAACHTVLGQLYRASGDTAEAVVHHAAALRLNPFMFDLFEQLCALGATVRVLSVYGRETPEPPELPPSYTRPQQTPDSRHVLRMPDAPLRKTKDTSANGSRAMAAPRKVSASQVHSRLLLDALPAPLRKRSSNAFLPVLQTPPRPLEPVEQQLLRQFGVFARACRAGALYDCFRAIRVLELLPEHEKSTPWVLSRLGRLHFEIVNYAEAEAMFVRLREWDRTRVADMEVYSTLLWHLHKEVELAFLAHECTEADREAPQTWTVSGNLFLLTHEQDEAIKCFQKATKADPRFAYAHTLQGHEYVALDTYENALVLFRQALLIDPRHYNALYGIGMVYLKTGDYSRAEFHFRKAVDINPVNVVLRCCVGMVLEKTERREQALRQYELAHRLQPLSALALFKRAQLLFSLEQYPQALAEFERVVELAPDEASVHFLLGQLYKIVGRGDDAIREFTVALYLDPKGDGLIREAIEL